MLLRDEAAQVRLLRDGWAPLPALDPPLFEALRALSRETDALLAPIRPDEPGYEQLWCSGDLELYQAVQRRLASLLAPYLEAHAPGCRLLMANLTCKRKSSPSTVHFHRDAAVVDERAGEISLQTWFPLVDVDPENGGLMLVEGSHREAPPVRPFGDAGVAQLLSPQLPPRTVTPPLRAGEGLVFLGGTVHGSPPNVTAVDRPAAAWLMVPRAAQVLHYVRRAPGQVERWALEGEIQFMQPGRLPPGARLVEVLPG